MSVGSGRPRRGFGHLICLRALPHSRHRFEQRPYQLVVGGSRADAKPLSQRLQLFALQRLQALSQRICVVCRIAACLLHQRAHREKRHRWPRLLLCGTEGCNVPAAERRGGRRADRIFGSVALVLSWRRIFQQRHSGCRHSACPGRRAGANHQVCKSTPPVLLPTATAAELLHGPVPQAGLQPAGHFSLATASCQTAHQPEPFVPRAHVSIGRRCDGTSEDACARHPTSAPP